ncbi:Aspartic proteinase-like protein 1 [Forsythia ovata]|uniref:Aspartic proteinase-like protein 1 n=1 Tax=Forsythia ovata TaxID=205694 RepID=A0ABD1PYJ2_9LAMI
MEFRFAAILVSINLLLFFDACLCTATTPIYSSRLIHRFSDEAQQLWVSKRKSNGKSNTQGAWPEKKSLEHMRLLLGGDLQRQRLRLGTQNQLLVPSQGGQTYNYGNDLGWLHYTWIDVGTPNTSFLVALDAGSDLFWVPCDCIQCAPLSLSYYYMLDRDLSQYSPSHSSTSKHLSCSHELCDHGPNCKNPKEHCPYTVKYLSDDTSSSGFLFEDQIHLASVGGNKQPSTAWAPVILGCGSKQSGEYLDGIAPDGLMGLGPGGISVPSLLAKSGLVPHSFSFCFDKSYSGRLLFGDQGPTSQRSTPFLPSKGKYVAYIVKVESYCVANSCLKPTEFKAQVDTGSSFTYLPHETYEQVAAEFDKQVNAKRIKAQGFDYCYKARSLKLPSMKLIFSMNQSFVIENPMFQIADNQGDLSCLGIHPMDGSDGIIGQNFLMGYRMVFDWEKLKLGWSISNCQDIGDSREVHPTSPPSSASPKSLPTIEQQRPHSGHAVPPAVAGRAPPKPSAASPPLLIFTEILWESVMEVGLLALSLRSLPLVYIPQFTTRLVKGSLTHVGGFAFGTSPYQKNKCVLTTNFVWRTLDILLIA